MNTANCEWQRSCCCRFVQCMQIHKCGGYPACWRKLQKLCPQRTHRNIAGPTITSFCWEGKKKSLLYSNMATWCAPILHPFCTHWHRSASSLFHFSVHCSFCSYFCCTANACRKEGKGNRGEEIQQRQQRINFRKLTDFTICSRNVNNVKSLRA